MNEKIKLGLELGTKIVNNSKGFFDYLSRPVQEADNYIISVIKEKGYIDNADLEKASLIYSIHKLHKEYRNLSKMYENADELFSKIDSSHMNINRPNEDWLAYFEDLASKVSDEAVQGLWAHLLVKEHIQSGSVTKAMLNAISLLDYASANSFNKLCKLTYKVEVDDGRVDYIPLVLYSNALVGITNLKIQDKNYAEYIKPFKDYELFCPNENELEYLRELNLIKLSESDKTCDIYSLKDMNMTFSVEHQSFDAHSIYDTTDEVYYLTTGQVQFTTIGLALYKALAVEPYSYLFKILNDYIEWQIISYGQMFEE